MSGRTSTALFAIPAAPKRNEPIGAGMLAA